jgi:mitochondrial import inner membrane translocase subunit TIM44
MYRLLPATRAAGRRIACTRPRRSLLSIYPPSNRSPPILGSSPFHTSSYRQNDQPKSPYQTFIDTLQEEIKKNRKFQEDLLQLKGDVDKLQDSETLKRATDAYERARVEFSSFCYHQFLIVLNFYSSILYRRVLTAHVLH